MAGAGRRGRRLGLPGPKGNHEFVVHLVQAEYPALPPELDRWIDDAAG